MVVTTLSPAAYHHRYRGANIHVFYDHTVRPAWQLFYDAGSVGSLALFCLGMLFLSAFWCIFTTVAVIGIYAVWLI